MAGSETEADPIFLSKDCLRTFSDLSSRDHLTRGLAMDSVASMYENWIKRHHQPPTESAPSSDVHENGDVSQYSRHLTQHLSSLIRLSAQCPFHDVRDRANEILECVKERGVQIPRPVSHGPSSFIPEHEIVPPETDDEQTRQLFVDAFLQNNRLENITSVMGFHPQYLESFLRLQHYLLRLDGPLPQDYRHYIGVMAAARHQCSYLVDLQESEFLMQDGDPDWLKGLDYIPQKLKNLCELNKILAHRPWLITKQHIEQLLRGNDSWSLSELVHAIVLLAHFHSLASFVFGTGINLEIDHECGHTLQPASLSDGANDVEAHHSNNVASSLESSEPGVEMLMHRMKKIQEAADLQEISQEEMKHRFEKVEKQSLELLPGQSACSECLAVSDYAKYRDDPHFHYEDFAKRGEERTIPTFRAQDYSWEDQGFSLVNRLYSDIGQLLDDKFRMAFNLTYYTMGPQKDVDTSMLRAAIWNYIHCMFGIFHDDYDYGEVNQLLDIRLKSFIKTVTCYPERTTRKDYDNFWKEFKHSEKVQVNLMVQEARMQAELLYALRAIMRYMM
ncbi:SESN1 [Branchiostoma lanceolatum]|uniref:SESN1 protein n=1 Tax=Branchiostoma lanceolatum TaxID=7740 RepID=A0A8J9VKD0_BRALA|nr:SESN1 [Branchiostoma lanceolatum]